MADTRTSNLADGGTIQSTDQVPVNRAGTNVRVVVTKAAIGLGNVDNTSNTTERAATATLANKTLTAPVIDKGIFTEAAAPATPAAGTVAIYAKADGLLYSKDDAGVETAVSGASGGGPWGTITGTLSNQTDLQAALDAATTGDNNQDTFAGDGSDTTFTLTAAPADNKAVVTVNGLVQTPTTDYSISGTTLTFVTAPANLDVIGAFYSAPALGGGAGDMFSVLTAAEISITGATTATIGRMHVCSGTSANYTVTLPAVSGNTGKFIGFRMASGLTKLVTLDGNSSETIDGATTRIMWANETCILFCDGTAWTKISGKTIPMFARLSLSSAGGVSTAQAITNATHTKVLHDTIGSGDNPTGAMADTGTSTITIRRPSTYNILVINAWEDTGAPSGFTATRLLGRVFLNTSTEFAGTEVSKINGAHPNFVTECTAPFVAGDVVHHGVYQNSGGTVYLYGAFQNQIAVLEIPTW